MADGQLSASKVRTRLRPSDRSQAKSFPVLGLGLRPSPTLSIIVPVHDGGDSLRQCLASAAACVPAAAEIIVVDDASRDASLAVARQAGARTLRLPVQSGPAQARNCRRAACARRSALLRRCRRGAATGCHCAGARRLRARAASGRRLRLVRRESAGGGEFPLAVQEPAPSLGAPDRLGGGLDVLGGVRRRPP